MTKSYKEQFDSEGYVVVPGVADAAAVEQLRRLCLSKFAAQNSTVLFDGLVQYPEFRDLIKPQSRLVTAMAEILGRPFILPPHSSAMLNSFGTFHTDTSSAELEGWDFPRRPDFRMVTVAIYLQDNDEYGGGITLVPRSNKVADKYVELFREKAEKRKKLHASFLRRALRRLSGYRLFDPNKELKSEPNAIDVKSKAGDAVIWDMRVVHRGTPQKLPDTRQSGGKIGIFLTAGADNAISREIYVNFVNSLPENAYVEKTRRAPGFVRPPATEDYVIL